MKAPLKKPYRHVVAAMVVSVFLIWTIGCSKKDGASGSPYRVENYEVVTMNMVGDGALLHATIKGPAAKLALFLTNPDGNIPRHSSGDSDILIIEKDRMITNSQEVSLLMSVHGKPKTGTWVLTAKTTDPENIVLHKEITITPAMVAKVKDE